MTANMLRVSDIKAFRKPDFTGPTTSSSAAAGLTTPEHGHCHRLFRDEAKPLKGACRASGLRSVSASAVTATVSEPDRKHEPGSGRHVEDVGDPDAVRCIGDELAFDPEPHRGPVPSVWCACRGAGSLRPTPIVASAGRPVDGLPGAPGSPARHAPEAPRRCRKKPRGWPGS